MDLLYIASALALWLLTVGLAIGCDKLRSQTK